MVLSKLIVIWAMMVSTVAVAGGGVHEVDYTKAETERIPSDPATRKQVEATRADVDDRIIRLTEPHERPATTQAGLIVGPLPPPRLSAWRVLIAPRMERKLREREPVVKRLVHKPISAKRRAALDASIANQVTEIKTLPSSVLTVHADDKRLLTLTHRVKDQAFVFVYDREDEARKKLAELHAQFKPPAVIYSGSASQWHLPELAGTTTIHRTLGSPQPVGVSLRAIQGIVNAKPQRIFNGIPSTTDEAKAQGLPRTSLDTYTGIHRKIAEYAKAEQADHEVTKAAFLDELQHGNAPTVAVFAHFDGRRLFFGNEAITLAELAALPARSNVAHRPIVLFVCEAGDTAVKVSDMSSVTDLVIAKGFGTVIVSSPDEVNGADVRKMFDVLGSPLGDLPALLNSALGQTWRLHAQRETVRSVTA